MLWLKMSMEMVMAKMTCWMVLHQGHYPRFGLRLVSDPKFPIPTHTNFPYEDLNITERNCLLQVMRFLTNPHKPMILALSRPDAKKNITTLVRAFGECRPLRELANLVSNSLPE